MEFEHRMFISAEQIRKDNLPQKEINCIDYPSIQQSSNYLSFSSYTALKLR